MVGKYEFESKEVAVAKIASLGVAIDEQGIEYPTHAHAVVLLGNITLSQGEYDEDGGTLVEPVLSALYAVDVLWDSLTDHPADWSDFAITPTNPKHSFLGVKQ